MYNNDPNEIVEINANTEKYGPLVGLYYLSLNQKFESNLTLPIKFDVNYEVIKKIKTGINFDEIEFGYNLSKDIYSNKNEYVTIFF